MAAKLTLTPFLLKEIKKLAEMGHFDRFIYGQLGIPRSTWYDWKKYAEETMEKIRKKEIHVNDLSKDEKLLSEFSDTVTIGRAKAVTRALERIIKTGATNWLADKWFLETIAPDLYGKREAVDLKHSGMPENINVYLNGKDPE